MSETYGVRLPPQKYCLTAIDFDLVPNKPPPQDVAVLSSDEGDDDGDDEEDEAEIDEAMDEDPLSPRRDMDGDTTMLTPGPDGLAGPSSMDALGLLSSTLQGHQPEPDASDSDDGPDGLFEDDDEDDQDDDSQGAPAAGGSTGAAPQIGEKRKLNEDDEYD